MGITEQQVKIFVIIVFTILSYLKLKQINQQKQVRIVKNRKIQKNNSQNRDNQMVLEGAQINRHSSQRGQTLQRESFNQNTTLSQTVFKDQFPNSQKIPSTQFLPHQTTNLIPLDFVDRLFKKKQKTSDQVNDNQMEIEEPEEKQAKEDKEKTGLTERKKQQQFGAIDLEFDKTKTKKKQYNPSRYQQKLGMSSERIIMRNNDRTLVKKSLSPKPRSRSRSRTKKKNRSRSRYQQFIQRDNNRRMSPLKKKNSPAFKNSNFQKNQRFQNDNHSSIFRKPEQQ